MRLEATRETPLVDISTEMGKAVLTGIVMPENALEFFKPVHEAMQDLLSEEKGIELIMEISYLNSMSNKEILKMLKSMEASGKDHTVVWKYDSSDRLMKTKGMELKVLCPKLKIQLES